MIDFATRLILWQARHGRHNLPWQGADAYGVWLSEIMLQQTQVVTVIPYFQRFVASFPDIRTLAAASEEQVLEHWSGLGYYARGRNLHKAARLIVEQHQAELPRQFESILALPGIGRSTAAAICALAYHESRAILDGNVKRVLARHAGILGWTGDKNVEERLWQLAQDRLPVAMPEEAWLPESPPSRIARYTQGMMDLGATVCTRHQPKCADCPVAADCIARATDRVSQLPAARPRKDIPQKEAIFLVLIYDGEILLEKRGGAGIWGGLWSPPQFDDEAASARWCLQQGIREIPTDDPHSEKAGIAPVALPRFTHMFSHFKLHITPQLVQLATKPPQIGQANRAWMTRELALQSAIPTPVRRILMSIPENQASVR